MTIQVFFKSHINFTRTFKDCWLNWMKRYDEAEIVRSTDTEKALNMSLIYYYILRRSGTNMNTLESFVATTQTVSHLTLLPMWCISASSLMLMWTNMGFLWSIESWKVNKIISRFAWGGVRWGLYKSIFFNELAMAKKKNMCLFKLPRPTLIFNPLPRP